MMDILNSIEACAAVNPNNRIVNPYTHLRLAVVHRTDLHTKAPGNPSPIPDDRLCGMNLSAVFRDPLLGTAGRIPYHGLILANGMVEQTLGLLTRGAHARGHNYDSVGWALVGNTDKQECSKEQWDALVFVFSVLAVIHGGLQIIGHTQIPGAAADPKKRCPGRYLDLDALQHAVESRTPTGWMEWDESRTMSWVESQGFTW